MRCRVHLRSTVKTGQRSRAKKSNFAARRHHLDDVKPASTHQQPFSSAWPWTSDSSPLLIYQTRLGPLTDNQFPADTNQNPQSLEARYHQSLKVRALSCIPSCRMLTVPADIDCVRASLRAHIPSRATTSGDVHSISAPPTHEHSILTAIPILDQMRQSS
jgi:hypothetical protein